MADVLRSDGWWRLDDQMPNGVGSRDFGSPAGMSSSAYLLVYKKREQESQAKSTGLTPLAKRMRLH